MFAMRIHLRAQSFWIVLIDILCLTAGSILGVVFRLGHEEIVQYVYAHKEGWLIFFFSIILANYLAGSYRIEYPFSRFNLVVTWLFAMVFTALVISITCFAWFTFLLGRGVLGLSVAVYGLLSLLARIVVFRRLFRRERFLCRAVVIGSGPLAQSIRTMVEGEYILPIHRVEAFINIVESGGSSTPSGRLDGVPVFNVMAGLFDEVVRSHKADLIVTALEGQVLKNDLYSRLRHLRFEGIEVLTALGAAETYVGRTPINLVDDEVIMRVAMESRLPLMAQFKRVFDIISSFLLGVVLLPAGALAALLIKLEEPRSPVFYTQTRTGQFGRPFRIYKFRTMREGAEDGTGPVWADDDDPRVTGLGRVLRRFRLDELPQLFNVLKGDMSVVGPRPERPEICAVLEKSIPYYCERANVMPGLTGWAQIRHPYGRSVEDTVRKLEYDLFYIRYLSFGLDIQIILRTLRIMLFGTERKM